MISRGLRSGSRSLSKVLLSNNSLRAANYRLGCRVINRHYSQDTPWYLRKEEIGTDELFGKVQKPQLQLPTNTPSKTKEIAEYMHSDLNLTDISLVDLSLLEMGSPFEEDAVFLIATGTSSTHLASAGQALATYIKHQYGQHIQTEGLMTPNFVRVLARRARKKAQRKGIVNRDPFEGGDDALSSRAGSWVVLKVDSVYIHIFTQEKREHVDLEELWTIKESRGWKKFDQKFEMPKREFHTSRTLSTASDDAASKYVRDLEIQQACGFVLTENDFSSALDVISQMTSEAKTSGPMLVNQRLDLVLRLHKLTFQETGTLLSKNDDLLLKLCTTMFAPNMGNSFTVEQAVADPTPIAQTSEPQHSGTYIDRRIGSFLTVMAKAPGFSADQAQLLFVLANLANGRWWSRFWSILKTQLVDKTLTIDTLASVVCVVVKTGDEANINYMLQYLPPVLSELNQPPPPYLSKALRIAMDYVKMPPQGAAGLGQYLN